MADIKIDINKLNSAIGKLDGLVSSVNSHRTSAMSNTPTDLPSLNDENLGRTTTWLTEQRPELVTRLDLAKLLDVDGDGQATYKVEHGDKLWEVKNALGDEMTNQLKNIDIKDVGGRQRAALLATLLNNYQNDPDVSERVMNGLGPEGLTTVMNKLRNLTGQYGNRYWERADNPGQEFQALVALQESMGKGLGGMFATASDRLPADFGKKVAQDPWAASVLLRYIDKANRDLNPAVFEAMGVELKNRERNDPMLWAQMFSHYDYSRFGEQDFRNLQPMREYLNVADNSTRASQAVMGNEDLLKYFISERQDWDDLSDQAGKVLQTATVDVALSDNDQYARNAADISSHALYILGDKDAKTLDGVKEEVGKIVGTYILSADETINSLGQAQPGIDMNPLKEPFTAADGFPKYGINLNKEILTNVLNDIGDNEEAARTVGQATSMYNQVLFDRTAGAGNTTEFLNMTTRASWLTGYMQDGLLDGKVIGENSDIESRKKAAELFTLPLDFIKTDKVPVIGPYIMGEVKDGISEAYAGDNAQAVAEAARQWDTSMTGTKLQAYYAMAASGNYKDLEVVQGWPTDGNGQPKSPDQLNRDDINAILGPIEGNDSSAERNNTDLAFDVQRNVNGAFDNLVNYVEPK